MTEVWFTFTTPTTTHITALHIVTRKHKWRLRTCCAIMSFCSYCLKRHCNNIQPVRAARHHVLIDERNVRNNGIRTWFCDDTRLCDINVVRSKLSCPEIIRNCWHDFKYTVHKRQARCLAFLEGAVSTLCLGMPLLCRIRVRRNVPVHLADRRLLIRIHEHLQNS
jgi:hypothetical protein